MTRADEIEALEAGGYALMREGSYSPALVLLALALVRRNLGAEPQAENCLTPCAEEPLIPGMGFPTSESVPPDETPSAPIIFLDTYSRKVELS